MVINRQDKLRIDVARARAFAARLAGELRLGARHFNVCFVDDDAIRELNGAFRNKPYATDVLSFAWNPACRDESCSGGVPTAGPDVSCSGGVPTAVRDVSCSGAVLSAVRDVSCSGGVPTAGRDVSCSGAVLSAVRDVSCSGAVLSAVRHEGGFGGEDTAATEHEFENFLGDVVISVETAQRNARAESHSTAAEIRWLILHGVLHLLGMDHEVDNGEMVARELQLRARLGLNGSHGEHKTRGGSPARPATGRTVRRQPASRARRPGSVPL